MDPRGASPRMTVDDRSMTRSAAEILREYGPFPGVDHVHGVTFDGQHVWFATGDKLNAFDPASGKVLRSIDVAAHAGTAFDGQHLFQIAEDRIQKIDPKTGRVLATIPAPAPRPRSTPRAIAEAALAGGKPLGLTIAGSTGGRSRSIPAFPAYPRKSASSYSFNFNVLCRAMRDAR